ncbi:MAG: hypothetical protein M1835_003352, partial [Candelina submexicana]
TDEVGYIPDAGRWNPVTVAIINKGINMPQSLEEFHFDNGKAPDDPTSYPVGKDVFINMKAFKVETSKYRGFTKWSDGYVQFANRAASKKGGDDQ